MVFRSIESRMTGPADLFAIDFKKMRLGDRLLEY
jgi:hypothetical protein